LETNHQAGAQDSKKENFKKLGLLIKYFWTALNQPAPVWGSREPAWARWGSTPGDVFAVCQIFDAVRLLTPSDL
jgi:hypothetical protein